MNDVITPEQAELLLMFGSLILVALVTRLVGSATWRKWFGDAPDDDNLTQEERDDRRIARKRRPR
ncbi:hypothetical protein [Protofrankia symbiont of Coriaria ruscifolia]|uniref:hypothetical protein n=1 Tax=Protofrankia symbiont of Coriaria ruscifolia TaxID=1306542 RepID=UPI001040F04A|nr:hypothetical protein [Protofrankia symbiont of Coriaria ruscifolia]